MRCSNCNKLILVKTKYCPKCGKEITNTKPKKNLNLNLNKKIIISVLILLVILLLLIAIILKEKYSVKNIGVRYFECIIEQDGKKCYKDLDFKKNDFTTMKAFNKVLKSYKLDDVINYTIQDFNYSENEKEAVITISYITKKSKKHQIKDIHLTKKGKKALIYNEWKINTKDIISKDSRIYIPKKYKAKLEGKKIPKKYLEKSNDKYNIYKIDEMFIGEYKIDIKQKNIDLESIILVQKNNSSSYINNPSLPKEISNHISKELVSQLEILYQNAIKSNDFNDFKKSINYTKNTKVKKIYSDLLKTTGDYYGQLKKYSVKNYNILNVKVNDNNIEMILQVNYDYKVNSEGKVKEKNKSDEIKFIIEKDKNKYKIQDIRGLTYHFK